MRLVGLLARLVTAVVVIGVLVAGVVATRIVVEARSDDRRPADAIVVLGAAQYDGRPQPYLAARLEHALALHREGIAPRVITVGGAQPGDRFTEAEAGRDWLVERGVAPQDVVAVPVGGNTLASMSAVALRMRDEGWDSAVVVTDPWHELRATEMLRQQGAEAFGSPTRTGPSNDGLGAAVPYVVRETGAYLYWLWQRVTT